MRTTVTLPDDLHEQTTALARDIGKSFSETVALLLRRSLDRTARPEVREDASGLLVSTGGPAVTAEDVRALDDD